MPRITLPNARERATKSPAADRLSPSHIIWDRPGYLVRRLHQIHVALFLSEIGNGGVTPIQYGLLSILVTRPNIDQFTIGEELGLDRANVADILKRLEARKLIKRAVDPGNRRRKLCLATAAGATLVRRHVRDMKRSQNLLLAPLSRNERALFMDLLTRLVNANNGSGRALLRGDARVQNPTPAHIASRPTLRTRNPSDLSNGESNG